MNSPFTFISIDIDTNVDFYKGRTKRTLGQSQNSALKTKLKSNRFQHLFRKAIPFPDQERDCSSFALSVTAQNTSGRAIATPFRVGCRETAVLLVGRFPGCRKWVGCPQSKGRYVQVHVLTGFEFPWANDGHVNLCNVAWKKPNSS